MPRAVSVIIPTHDRAGLIGETIEAVLRQTAPPAEVIVVDDGSTDDTEQVVGRFGHAVSYHRIDNRGAPAARHAGVQRSRHRSVAFCDSDDLWQPDHLSRMNALFDSSNRLDYAFANFVEFSGDGAALPGSATSKFDMAPQGFWDVARLHPRHDGWIIEDGFVDNLICFQPIFPSTVVMSRDLYDRVGGFDPAMSHVPSEDLEFTLRCVRRGPIGVIAHPTVRVRKHPGNVSRSKARQVIGEICVLNHVLNHHDVSGFTRAYIMEDLERRCRAALDLAFACGDDELVRMLNAAVDHSSLGARQKLKVRIAALPHPLAGLAKALLTSAEFTQFRGSVSRFLRMHLYIAIRDIVARRGAAWA